MNAAFRKNRFVVVLAGCLGIAGCVYNGDHADTLEKSGTPVGITAVKIPFEKLVTQVPPPAGFSSTYQKQLVEHQRLARLKAERAAQAQAKSSGGDSKSKVEPVSQTTKPPV